MPNELQGRWRAVLGTDDVSTLDIGATWYTITRIGHGQGGLRLRGDQLVFLPSNLCEGEGHYDWSLEGESLRFEMIGADECPGRADALSGRTYTRAE